LLKALLVGKLYCHYSLLLLIILLRDATQSAVYCHSKSVCDFKVSWSHRLEYVKSNLVACYRRVFTVCRPQHHGSTRRGSSRNYNWNRGRV